MQVGGSGKRGTKITHAGSCMVTAPVVITGGASGIGLAAAMQFAALGMKVCIADIGAERLRDAATKLSSLAPGGAASVMTATVDVSRADDVAGLETPCGKSSAAPIS